MKIRKHARIVYITIIVSVAQVMIYHRENAKEEQAVIDCVIFAND